MNLLFNPLNAELNPICHLLALLGVHHILHVSRIRVNYAYAYDSDSLIVFNVTARLANFRRWVFLFFVKICSRGYVECRNAYSLSACNTVWWTGASSCNDAEFSHDFGMAEACVLTVTIEISQVCSSCCEADCGLVGQDIVCLMLNTVTFFMRYILMISSLVIFRIAFYLSCCPPCVLHA